VRCLDIGNLNGLVKQQLGPCGVVGRCRSAGRGSGPRTVTSVPAHAIARYARHMKPTPGSGPSCTIIRWKGTSVDVLPSSGRIGTFHSSIRDSMTWVAVIAIPGRMSVTVPQETSQSSSQARSGSPRRCGAPLAGERRTAAPDRDCMNYVGNERSPMASRVAGRLCRAL
jgi:hypothetical protein